jgi:hypothetical protein
MIGRGVEMFDIIGEKTCEKRKVGHFRTEPEAREFLLKIGARKCPGEEEHYFVGTRGEMDEIILTIIPTRANSQVLTPEAFKRFIGRKDSMVA